MSRWAALVLLALVACSGPLTEPRVGEVRLSARLAGAEPDDNEIVVLIDSSTTRAFSAQVGAFSIYEISSGIHRIELTKLAANCAVVDGAARQVTVETKQTTSVTFGIKCVPTGLAVITRTTGIDTSHAYKVVIGDSIAARPGARDSVVVSHLKPGTLTVSLAVPLDNCAVTSPNAVTTQAVPHALVTVHFDVACGPRVHIPKIAFVMNTVESMRGEWIGQMNVDGSSVERFEPGHSPSWSPDGTKLVLSRAYCDFDWDDYFYDCNGGLTIVNAERWTAVQLPIDIPALEPAWSPRGDRIAFTSCCQLANNGLYVAALDGSIAAMVRFSSLIGYGHPTWSPDGERIAFSCLILNRGFAWDICIAPVRGGEATVLSRRPDDQLARTLPAWSPDGSRIVFVRPGLQLAVYWLATDDVTPLTEGTEPAWSPDGTAIVFARSDGVFSIDADGTNLRRITRGPHSTPAWRP